jgi:hypothetical protein
MIGLAARGDHPERVNLTGTPGGSAVAKRPGHA